MISSGGFREHLDVAGRRFYDLANLIVLAFSLKTSGYSGCRLIGETSAYQVNTGKTLQIHAMNFFGLSSTDQNIEFGYADADPGWDGGSEPSGWAEMHNDTTTQYRQFGSTGNHSTADRFNVAADKYFICRNAGSAIGLGLAYGYEV